MLCPSRLQRQPREELELELELGRLCHAKGHCQLGGPNPGQRAEGEQGLLLVQAAQQAKAPQQRQRMVKSPNTATCADSWACQTWSSSTALSETFSSRK